MLGLMQDRPLLISSMIEFAASYYPDVEIVTRTAGNDFDKLPALIRELVAEKPDLLFVSAEPGLRAAKAATRSAGSVVTKLPEQPSTSTPSEANLIEAKIRLAAGGPWK